MDRDWLILRALRSEADAEERRKLDEWRAADAANEAYWLDFVWIWNVAGVAEDALPRSGPPSAEDLLRGALDGYGNPDRRWARWAARAAAVVALVVGGYLLADLHQPPATRLSFGANEVVTGPDDEGTVALRDGTVIHLAPGSRLRVTGTLDEREVALSGRAYFAVARRNGSLFRILTAAGEVTVLGTRFDLQAEEEDLRLLVVEGRVAVSAPGGEVVIHSGQAGGVSNRSLLPVVRAQHADSVVSWKGNFLAFQRTPLRKAAAEIERQYGVRIEVTDSVLAARTITTWFADRTLDDVLRVVCAVAVADCETDGGVVRMQPQPGSERLGS